MSPSTIFTADGAAGGGGAADQKEVETIESMIDINLSDYNLSKIRDAKNKENFINTLTRLKAKEKVEMHYIIPTVEILYHTYRDHKKIHALIFNPFIYQAGYNLDNICNLSQYIPKEQHQDYILFLFNLDKQPEPFIFIRDSNYNYKIYITLLQGMMPFIEHKIKPRIQYDDLIEILNLFLKVKTEDFYLDEDTISNEINTSNFLEALWESMKMIVKKYTVRKEDDYDSDSGSDRT